MCVNEPQRNAAIKIRDEAEEEMIRCNQGIGYFGGWTGRINGCIGCLDQMISQVNAIGVQCESIIINGNPIDKGQRHYPNGGAYTQAANLESAKKTLEEIKAKVDENMEALKASHKKAKADYDSANYEIATHPVPCGRCNECCPQTATTTSGCSSGRRTTTSGCSSARTAAVSGGGSSNTTSTTRTGTTRSGGGGGATYNRAVMVAIE